METYIQWIVELLAAFVAVCVVLSLHEFAHAFVAYKCGDPTPKFYGRLTVNPVAHFDPLGLIMFTVAGFGWAKPVPINPNNFKKYKKGLALTAVAGVVMNYITAFLFCPLFLVVLYYVRVPWWPLQQFLFQTTYFLFAYSLGFCVFNLIPLPPLDGWRVVQAVNKSRGKVYRFFERYGNMILLILIGIHFLVNFMTNYAATALLGSYLSYIDVLGYIMSFATQILGWPISEFWGLIF